MKENKELRDQLANLTHKQWVGWTKDLFSECVRKEDGSLTIPSYVVEGCEQQMNTAYKDLSESEKYSNMKEVDKFLDVFENYLARCEEELENDDSGILLGRDPDYEALLKYMR